MNMQEKIEGALAHANMSKTEVGKAVLTSVNRQFLKEFKRVNLPKKSLSRLLTPWEQNTFVILSSQMAKNFNYYSQQQKRTY